MLNRTAFFISDGTGITAGALGTVSYTHLDVYKRQTLNQALKM